MKYRIGAVLLFLYVASGFSRTVRAQDLPTLTQPLNDFAHVVDGQSAAEIDRIIRALKAASGDIVVVATVPTIEPYGTVDEYAVKLFENHGRGIGDKGKDNGVLILAALKERKLRIEVGYDLEQWITDGFSGETIREFIGPPFRQNQYGAGLLAGTRRIAGRIAQARGVSIEGVPLQPAQPARGRGTGSGIPFWVIILIIILFSILGGRGGGGRGRRTRYWGGGGWSGWSSGVGPFGGGWSSGGGGGFGGGFGGFGGGRSGGGGASGSW